MGKDANGTVDVNNVNEMNQTNVHEYNIEHWKKSSMRYVD